MYALVPLLGILCSFGIVPAIIYLRGRRLANPAASVVRTPAGINA